MAETDVSNTDTLEAATFLQVFLQEKIPDGDFTPGSPTYDFAIQSVAYIFAYLRKKITVIRNRQSLLTLQVLPEEESVADAADALLANFFRTRQSGQRSRGNVVLHFSQRVDVLVQRNTRFFKTAALIYYLDSDQDGFFRSTQLLANRGPDGRVVDYTLTISVVAARPGQAYNQPAGRFVGLDQFSPFVTFVENTVPFNNGEATQSTQEFIDRSSTAISLRALINARSNDAVLVERFPVVEKVLTVNYGDSEMVRDIVSEVASGVVLHAGGSSDIFIRTAIAETTDEGVLGDLYARPDNRATIFRDTSGLRNFVTGFGLLGGIPIVPGDVLYVGSGIPESPFQYVIREVNTDTLGISARTPFSTSTDEAPTPVSLTVSIGNNYPLFNNKLATTTSPLLFTSRKISAVNQIMLTGQPAYKIKKVEVFNAPSTFDPFKDPITDTLIFTKRSNVVLTPPVSGDELAFRVHVLNPAETQSAKAVTMIEVGWPGGDLTGLNCRVTYDTLSQFDLVDEFVRGEQDRVSVANTIPRAFHPIYLSFNIPYTLSVIPNPFRGNTIVPFDEAAGARSVSAFINGYRALNVIDVSLISTQLRLLTDSIAAVYPFTLLYDLYATDGRVYHFETTDRVSLTPDGRNGVRLLNPTDFGLPTSGYETMLQDQLRLQGISDRLTRFFASDADISFEQRT